MTGHQAGHEDAVTRASDETPLAGGDLIHISAGCLPQVEGEGAKAPVPPVYLYVINREQFGATLTNSRLIFPTLATYEGDNILLPGKTVTLPDPTRPFRIMRGSSGGQAQAFETYTLILSPVPLNSELPG